MGTKHGGHPQVSVSGVVHRGIRAAQRAANAARMVVGRRGLRTRGVTQRDIVEAALNADPAFRDYVPPRSEP